MHKVLELSFQLSLFFDFLLPTCSNVSENDFVTGVRGGSMGMPGDKNLPGSHCEDRDTFLDVMPLARKLIWDAFRSFKTQAGRDFIILHNCSFDCYLVCVKFSILKCIFLSLFNERCARFR